MQILIFFFVIQKRSVKDPNSKSNQKRVVFLFPYPFLHSCSLLFMEIAVVQTQSCLHYHIISGK